MTRDEFAQIVAAVAEAFMLTPQQVLCKGRSTRQAEARWVIAYVLRTGQCMPLTAIGQRLGRDHTTVMHGLREIEKRPDLVSLAGMFMRPTREVA